MYSKLLGLGLIAGLASASVFAEPAVQPGETLESLSKVKITTTVNGQPGSLNELMANGQIQPITAQPNSADTTPAPSDSTPAVESAPATEVQPSPANAQVELPDPNAAAQASPEISSSADAPVNVENSAEEAPVQAQPNTNHTESAIQASPEAPQTNEDAFAQ